MLVPFRQTVCLFLCTVINRFIMIYLNITDIKLSENIFNEWILLTSLYSELSGLNVEFVCSKLKFMCGNSCKNLATHSTWYVFMAVIVKRIVIYRNNKNRSIKSTTIFTISSSYFAFVSNISTQNDLTCQLTGVVILTSDHVQNEDRRWLQTRSNSKRRLHYQVHSTKDWHSFSGSSLPRKYVCR